MRITDDRVFSIERFRSTEILREYRYFLSNKQIHNRAEPCHIIAL